MRIRAIPKTRRTSTTLWSRRSFAMLQVDLDNPCISTAEYVNCPGMILQWWRTPAGSTSEKIQPWPGRRPGRETRWAMPAKISTRDSSGFNGRTSDVHVKAHHPEGKNEEVNNCVFSTSKTAMNRKEAFGWKNQSWRLKRQGKARCSEDLRQALRKARASWKTV